MSKNKSKKTVKTKIENFNFKQGDLFLTLGYLSVLSSEFKMINELEPLHSICNKKLFRLKERNNLKIDKKFKEATCPKCSAFTNSDNKFDVISKIIYN